MKKGIWDFCHRLFYPLSKGDHNWAKDTLKVSGEWESDSSPKLRILTAFIDGK